MNNLPAPPLEVWIGLGLLVSLVVYIWYQERS